MKKLILSVAVVFTMSSFCAFAQDAKPVKKEAKTEQCCQEGAEKKQGCCKETAKSAKKVAPNKAGQCCQKEVKKAPETKADKK